MIFLDEEAVLRLAVPGELIAQIERAFAASEAMPSRMHCDLPGADAAKLLIMPAWLQRDAIGVKVATVMPANPAIGHPTINGLYLLLDGQTGHPRATLSAQALTAVRTAAVSGLAASYLSRADARTLLMIGTGALASHLIRAHAAVRRYDRILVWGRSPAKAASLAKRAASAAKTVEPVENLGGALREADVISCATATTTPLVTFEMVKAGTHIDLVGSFTPAMHEADSATFAHGRVVVDTLDALRESGDLMTPLSEGVIEPSQVATLSALVRDSGLRRRNETEVTVFKAVGTGLADVAAASHLYQLHLARAKSHFSAAPATVREPQALPRAQIG